MVEEQVSVAFSSFEHPLCFGLTPVFWYLFINLSSPCNVSKNLWRVFLCFCAVSFHHYSRIISLLLGWHLSSQWGGGLHLVGLRKLFSSLRACFETCTLLPFLSIHPKSRIVLYWNFPPVHWISPSNSSIRGSFFFGMFLQCNKVQNGEWLINKLTNCPVTTSLGGGNKHLPLLAFLILHQSLLLNLYFNVNQFYFRLTFSYLCLSENSITEWKRGGENTDALGAVGGLRLTQLTFWSQRGESVWTRQSNSRAGRVLHESLSTLSWRPAVRNKLELKARRICHGWSQYS